MKCNKQQAYGERRQAEVRARNQISQIPKTRQSPEKGTEVTPRTEQNTGGCTDNWTVTGGTN